MMIKKLAVGIASSALLITTFGAVAPMTVSAADSFTYTSIKGGETSFDKYLIMRKAATVPNVDFEFTVAPIEDSEVLAAETGTLPVLKGPDGIIFKTDQTTPYVTLGDPATTATVSFSPSDNNSNTYMHMENETGLNKYFEFKTPSDRADEKFVQKPIKIDLSAVTFTEPGIYRYKITESPTSNYAAIEDDSTKVRYLDVYVEDVNGILSVDGYFLHKTNYKPQTGDTATVTNGEKSKGFANYYNTNRLTFTKTVEGNQGSKDKYFKFTVKLDNPQNYNISDNDVFQVEDIELTPTKTDATFYDETVMRTANNITSLTYGDLKAGYDVYLKNGQTVSIRGIPLGLKYTVTEAFEDYTPSVVLASNNDNDTKTDDMTGEGTSIEGVKDGNGYKVEDSYLKNGAMLSFTNSKQGVIPSGVLTTVAGSAVIVLIGLAGVVGGVFCLRKKRTEED